MGGDEGIGLSAAAAADIIAGEERKGRSEDICPSFGGGDEGIGVDLSAAAAADIIAGERRQGRSEDICPSFGGKTTKMTTPISLSHDTQGQLRFCSGYLWVFVFFLSVNN